MYMRTTLRLEAAEERVRQVLQLVQVVLQILHLVVQLLRLVAEGLRHSYRKASNTSSIRPHTLVDRTNSHELLRRYTEQIYSCSMRTRIR
jgi:hypothetical protein